VNKGPCCRIYLVCYITAQSTDKLCIGLIFLQTHTQFKISPFAIAENITYFKRLCHRTICKQTHKAVICNVFDITWGGGSIRPDLSVLNNCHLSSSLRKPAILPLHCLLHFCLSLHPFQFLPEVRRCYSDWIFLFSWPDKAITWETQPFGHVTSLQRTQQRTTVQGSQQCFLQDKHYHWHSLLVWAHDRSHHLPARQVRIGRYHISEFRYWLISC